MTFTVQNNTLFLTFSDVDLRLCVQKLLAPIPLCFHLQFELALESDACSAAVFYLFDL